MSGTITRGLRLGLLLLACWCLRDAQQRRQAVEDATALKAEKVRDFFPTAETVEEVAPGEAQHRVLDGSGIVVGYVAQTAPESDRIIGYSGPTNTLIAFDSRGKVLGLRILRSGDTSDHLAEVVSDRGYFRQFVGMTGKDLSDLEVRAVSGSTLTSSAITEGVLGRLGGVAATSLRFPEPISVEEVRDLLPEADRLEEPVEGLHAVLDGTGKVIGRVTRTAPLTDTLIGYKGPTDSLMVLDPNGEILEGLRIRRSYDTERYVGYVTGDAYFMGLFDGRRIEDLAVMDFKEEKVEGVSGATETSWALAEGLKRRSAELLNPPSSSASWLGEIRWRWQDTGHVVVIASAFLMAFTPLRGRGWARHLHHLFLVGYGGFFVGEMLSQGLLAGWSAHGSPWRNAPGLVLLTAVALLAPVFSRRQIYCHHVCPHGALQQLVARRLPWQWSPSKRLNQMLSRLPLILLAVVLFAAMLAWPLDLNQIEPFDAYVFHVAGAAAIAIALLGLVWSLFTPLAYCRYGCPTGGVFRLLRVSGNGDRVGRREALAAALILIAWGLSHA